jgi:hypothetical protein
VPDQHELLFTQLREAEGREAAAVRHLLPGGEPSLWRDVHERGE